MIDMLMNEQKITIIFSVMAYLTFNFVSCCQSRENHVFLHRIPSTDGENNTNGKLIQTDLYRNCLLFQEFRFNKLQNISFLLFIVLNKLFLDHLSLFLPTICSNQDLVRTLIKRNPEEFRFLAESLAFLSLPEDLTINSINLTQLCQKDESSSDNKNNLKLPDEGKIVKVSNR